MLDLYKFKLLTTQMYRIILQFIASNLQTVIPQGVMSSWNLGYVIS